MCKEYNGYTNYQTWNVALWLDNEQPTNEMLHQLANKADDYAHLKTVFDRAEYLKNYMEEVQEVAGIQVAGTFADLLSHALANVNWVEIIRSHEEA